ncbi:MAG: hypothetical protein GY928_38460 [Colwellia sp.]|nr:hypothetical protein [Colwellia sp.]
MNKNFYNNTSFKFGIYPRSDYNENTLTSQFEEFAFDNQPLYKSHSKISRTLYSAMNSDQFKNTCTVQLDNAVIKHIVGIDDVRETSFYSHYEAQGISLKKDYVFRIWKSDGINTDIYYTGVVTDIKQTEKEVTLTLNSRANDLQYSDGTETKTDLAGWEENVRFSTALDVVLDGTDVEIKGDINEIEYYETENEGDLDLRAFKGSIGVFLHEDNEVVIANNSVYNPDLWGTKFNFVTDTVEPFSATDIIHYQFKRKDNTIWYVVEDNGVGFGVKDRIGQYAKLYLVEEGNWGNRDKYLGYGRVAENIEYGSNTDKIGSMDGYYVYDTIFDKSMLGESFLTFLGRTDGENNTSNASYAYYGRQNWESEGFVNEDTEYLMGQIVNYDGYFMPLFGRGRVKDLARGGEESRWNDGIDADKFQLLRTAKTKLGFGDTNKGVLFTDNNSQAYDVYNFFGTSSNSLKRLDSRRSQRRQNESIKSRSYFSYNANGDSLFFQRASDSAPVSGSEIIGTQQHDGQAQTDLVKNWTNFGLNPIGYYNMANDTLHYSDKTNNNFIVDWSYMGGSIFSIVIEPKNINYQLDEIVDCKITETLGINTTELASFSSYFLLYGLSYFNKTNDCLGFIQKSATDWNFVEYNLITETSNFVSIGSVNSWNALTGSATIEGKEMLLGFKNGLLQYVDIYTQANNNQYVSEMLSSRMGGYIVKNDSSEDFTAKFEENVITFHNQLRIEVLDLTDNNRLQALLMLCKMANKFMYVNEKDIFIVKNKENIASSGKVIDSFVKNSVSILDREEYKSVNINSYNYKRELLFEWTLGRGEYIDTLNGVWYGKDCSFSVMLKVTSPSSFEYTLYSSSSIIAKSKTTVNAGGAVWPSGDWSNITITIDDDFFTLEFLELNTNNEKVPATNAEFRCVFNSKVLEKTSVNIIETDSDSESVKTKTIDNKLIYPNIATMYKDDVKEYFLGAKKAYKVEINELLTEYDLTETILFNCYYFQQSKNCYVRNLELTKKGTTSLYLVEV